MDIIYSVFMPYDPKADLHDAILVTTNEEQVRPYRSLKGYIIEELGEDWPLEEM